MEDGEKRLQYDLAVLRSGLLTLAMMRTSRLKPAIHSNYDRASRNLWFQISEPIPYFNFGASVVDLQLFSGMVLGESV
jgi:hypothetical protein